MFYFEYIRRRTCRCRCTISNHISSSAVFLSFRDDLSQSLWSSGSEIHLAGLDACCLSSGCNTYPMSPTSSATPAFSNSPGQQQHFIAGHFKREVSLSSQQAALHYPWHSLAPPPPPPLSEFTSWSFFRVLFFFVYSTFVHGPWKPLCSFKQSRL